MSGQATTADDLAAIVVSTVNGVPVRVGDVATVRPGLEPRFTIVTADGRPAALVNILRQPTANIVTVSDDVKTALAALKSQLPPDVEVKPFYDQSLLVRSSVGSVRDAILIGLVLSVLILYGFLRNWGTTLVATLVIPITVLVTFVAMWIVGLSFDLMTLGGVAAAIGLVIDDAIVVVENIYTHMARGESRADAVHKAIAEIAGPIVGSTITPVVVFVPLALLTGVTGVFFRSLALTMSVALLTSLVLALTFTPVVAEHLIRVPKTHEEEKEGPLLGRLIRGYEWLLSHSLRRPAVVLIAVVAVAALSYVA
ncbi:MAG TPA: efflux RND transporter permease subunit, partial [Thermoanaerobaculia bacterium]|nr:efflux RND transporter permease subunit [Thermoanaerobaculia bacterium]